MVRKMLVLGVLALSACTPVEVMEEQACARLGITSYDPRFETCLDRMEVRRQADMAASLGMLNVGAGMMAGPPSMNVYVH